MKAAVLHGKEDVRIEAMTPLELKPGEARVEIKAALTCGTDLKVYRRGYHARMIVPPAVFGHELSGVISELHPETPGWNIGDRVVVANSAPCGTCFYCRKSQENLCDDLLFLNGAYAESIVVPARIVKNNMLPLAGSTSFRDAALTEPLACVAQGVEELKLGKGEHVLVLGCGPIGLMFVALARDAGCEVTAVGRGQARLETALKLGAKKVVELKEGDDAVSSLKSSERFDVVVEAVGKPETWEVATRLVRKGGRVNFFGGCPSGTSVNLDTSLIHYSNLTLLASFHHTPATIRKALAFIERGIIRAEDFVTGECGLSELPALLASMTRGNKAVKTFIHVDR
jgi:L-iditol 2-dehydrogenase